jgi:hypothetical protein
MQVVGVPDAMFFSIVSLTFDGDATAEACCTVDLARATFLLVVECHSTPAKVCASCCAAAASCLEGCAIGIVAH